MMSPQDADVRANSCHDAQKLWRELQLAHVIREQIVLVIYSSTAVRYSTHTYSVLKLAQCVPYIVRRTVQTR
jgi:hypothetical protein